MKHILHVGSQKKKEKKTLQHVCWIKIACALLFSSICSMEKLLCRHTDSKLLISNLCASTSDWSHCSYLGLIHAASLRGFGRTDGRCGRERKESCGWRRICPPLSLSLPTPSVMKQPTLQTLQREWQQYVFRTGLSLYSHWVHTKGLRSCIFMFVLKTKMEIELVVTLMCGKHLIVYVLCSCELYGLGVFS